jgi:UDP-N-acetylmuramate dehydrogenase
LQTTSNDGIGASYNRTMPLILQERVSLKPFNAFGVDARAAFFARVMRVEHLAAIEAERRLLGVPRIVLGGGTNVLFAADFDGLVVKIDLPGLRAAGETGDDWLVEVGAGEDWHSTVERLISCGRPGLENLALIPGQAGAAPIQNIGAYGLELAERFQALSAWDVETRRVVDMTPEECDFGYRDSVFKHRFAGGRRVVLGMTLRLPKRWEPAVGYAELARELSQRGAAQPDARAIFDAVCALRRRKLPDPSTLGNAGSFFKNPIVTRERRTALLERFPSLVSYALPGGTFKLAAGWLIEASGLKGVTRGRAGVYERQALVLVNRGGATGREILDLAREVQAKVFERFGVALEPETVIV